MLPSEPVGGRSRATELPCFILWPIYEKLAVINANDSIKSFSSQFIATILVKLHAKIEKKLPHKFGINACAADIRGRLINNSSVTFRPFINIAGNYQSSPCTHVPNIVHNLRTPHSGFGLRVLPTSLIHTNNLSNILPVLLQHKYTLQFTNNSFHFNTESL